LNTIFLAVPHYGDLVAEALPSLMRASVPPNDNRIILNTNGASLLAFNFNLLWTSALNQRKERGITHFAMHHSDVQAEIGWLDKLIAEMTRTRCDVLSVVLPIKDEKGLTSTGFMDKESGMITRLTMKQVYGNHLPRTFDKYRLRNHGHAPRDATLMVNTGLFLVDFTKPWVEEAHFEIRDRIVKTPEGRFIANVLPEDWNFSVWCNEKGLDVRATTVVKATHHGRAGFANDHAWGDWETDQGDQR